MKTVIIYNSQTGFTAQYAEWMAKELNCPCIRYQDRDRVNLKEYDTILFGSWCHAGTIVKADWFKKQLPELKGRKVAVFAVGASPADNPEIDKSFDKNFTAEERRHIRIFYLQGGLRYEKMSFTSRTMMKLFCQVMKKNKNKTPDEEKMSQMICQSYDASDKKFIQPVLAYVNEK